MALPLVLALALPILVGCATTPTLHPPTNQSPNTSASPELLQPPASGTTEMRLSCGGRTFPVLGLEALTGAEKAAGPEFDALRATLKTFASEFPGSEKWTWRLADRDATGAIFVAEVDASARPGWASIEVVGGPSGWGLGGMGQCSPFAVLSGEFKRALWIVDPTFDAPTPDSTQLHLLVEEASCASGSAATGRMSVLRVEYASTKITITIGVRPRDGAQTCPSNPPTLALLPLAEPLGVRSLLDGGKWPPVPPSLDN